MEPSRANKLLLPVSGQLVKSNCRKRANT